MSQPGTVLWFAHHEVRLAWRDFISMITAGRRRRTFGIVIGFLIFAGLMHGLANYVVGSLANVGIDPERDVLVYATAIGILASSLMISQALEAVTRAFYARADLDLILTSPAVAPKVFSIRIMAIAFTTFAMAVLLAGPFINILVIKGGARWLTAYGMAGVAACFATAFAVGISILLFHVIGPRRARFVAQVVAAIVGATFVIGLQAAAILTNGTISRFAILQSEKFAELLPPVESIVWLPARALTGDVDALIPMLALAALVLAGAIALFATRFADYAIATAGVTELRMRAQAKQRKFRALSAMQVLRRKEWTLLLRDPWLISQTLMQLLYLLPPALLLWRKFGEDGDTIIVIVPVLVVAAGQLAGGLAWLAVSGEDAPDLIATAPVPTRMIIRAKVEAVLGAIAVVSSPLVILLALSAPWAALVTAVAIAIAATASTTIQLLFKGQAKRSHFRRRQTSSRVATFAEALSSMAWAATAGLAAAGTWFAIGSGIAALFVLLVAWMIHPRPAKAQLIARPA
ncbi:permease [Bauldia litoralis]|uniref:ABC-2 type transport system permease protein n=1 Tax=Bauldia litoralis TaxID=665467 RepID=A0A1G6AIF4_9HYPH|nr:permease [Bauldia litoralis]SDB08192.1 ABC-2 type transport system permease protein [Bauldia litoralis]